jgi:YegS/Rv2252/BmrU family lipid kinase
VSRRLALLVNPTAAGGRALKVLRSATDELDRLGASHRTIETQSVEHAAEQAQEAASQGETPTAVGGDGLVRPVAAALRRAESALAIIPGGRGNDFARVLGIPSDPSEAARTALDGAERLVDVAEVNGTPFIGIASLGFNSDANHFANEARLVKGNLVYLYAGLRTLAGWKPAKFTVVVDGEHHEIRGYGVSVGNSKVHGGGMLLFPHAELDDGKLEVLLDEEHSKLTYLGDMVRVFKGRHIGKPYVHLLQGSEVEVSADRPFVVYADGDPLATTPARMRVERRCLRVVVPATG